MKQPIRLFSIGLFSASLIALIVLLFIDDAKSNVENVSTDDMITALKDDGYRVLTEPEYISLSVNDNNDKKAEDETDQASEEKQEDADKKATEDKKKDKEEKTYTIKIKSGMASSEISDQLAENDIINDADEFSQYLKEEGYETKVQLGKFKVSSDMNKKEIAEELTK